MRKQRNASGRVKNGFYDVFCPIFFKFRLRFHALVKMTKKSPTPNDDRSRALNPTSRDYQAAQDNRSRQLNPEDEVYHFSRGEKEE